jgi:hypothetical protein
LRLSPAQVVVLRLGAVLCLVGAVVTTIAAITVDSGSPSSSDVTVVDRPTDVALPDPGLFGSEIVVYGASGDAGVAPSDLGCRLLSEQGTEQSSAKMSELRVLSTPPITVDGDRLDALFTVGGYPSGATLACTDATSVAPLAISAPSTFGRAGLVVRITAGVATFAFLAVGVGGLLLLRRRP